VSVRAKQNSPKGRDRSRQSAGVVRTGRGRAAAGIATDAATAGGDEIEQFHHDGAVVELGADGGEDGGEGET